MRVSAIVLLAVASFLAAGARGEPCDPDVCNSATCRCSSTDTPGGLDPSEIPQFVVISFDDAITVTNYPFYERLQERVNPNGCPIKMTYFVSHVNTDYTLVHDLYRNGHEIAVHSVTHHPYVSVYWNQLDKEGWVAEMQQQRAMLNQYGKIPLEAIKGWRAPFLEIGGNAMYEALAESGFEYDCSWSSLHYTPWYMQPGTGVVNGALWPYTLDYDSIQDVPFGSAPNVSIPGTWVSPMTDLLDFREAACAMLDACQGVGSELETHSEAVTKLLLDNFISHSEQKTPFGLYTHHSWFADEVIGPIREKGFEDFLNQIKAFPDVYLVSVQQLLEWVKNPVPLSEMEDHDAFSCSGIMPSQCTNTINCHYEDSEEAPLPMDQLDVYMNFCGGVCPEVFPYLGNIDGDAGDDYIIPPTPPPAT